MVLGVVVIGVAIGVWAVCVGGLAAAIVLACLWRIDGSARCIRVGTS